MPFVFTTLCISSAKKLLQFWGIQRNEILRARVMPILQIIRLSWQKEAYIYINTVIQCDLPNRSNHIQTLNQHHVPNPPQSLTLSQVLA